MDIFEEKVFLNLMAALDGLTPKERVEVIDDVLHRLNFEKRVALLTRGQKEHMSMSLSDAQRERLASCKTEEERTEVVEGYARANYIRKCAWDEYLHGLVDDPPFERCIKEDGRGHAEK